MKSKFAVAFILVVSVPVFAMADQQSKKQSSEEDTIIEISPIERDVKIIPEPSSGCKDSSLEPAKTELRALALGVDKLVANLTDLSSVVAPVQKNGRQKIQVTSSFLIDVDNALSKFPSGVKVCSGSGENEVQDLELFKADLRSAFESQRRTATSLSQRAKKAKKPTVKRLTATRDKVSSIVRTAMIAIEKLPKSSTIYK